MRPLILFVLGTAFIAIEAGPASADLRKLDARTRFEYEQLQSGLPAQALRDRGFAVPSEGTMEVFVRGDAGRAALEAAGARVRSALPGICTADLPFSAVEPVSDLPEVTAIVASMAVEDMTDISVPATGASALRGPGPLFTGLNGEGVLVGIIDSGIDWMSPDFRNPDGTTRVKAIWDLTDSRGAPPSAVSGLPFTTGSEWTEADLNHAIAGGPPIPRRDTHHHGSLCFGIAVSSGAAFNANSAPAYTYVGMAPRASLIVGRGSTDGHLTEAGIVDQANWMMQRADQLGMPCVINISQGHEAGPHDGSLPIEVAFDALSGPGHVIVISAGNFGYTFHHAQLDAGSAANYITANLQAFIPGAHEVVLQGAYDHRDNLDFTITTPQGAVLGPVHQGAMLFTGSPNGTVRIENGYTLTSRGDPLVTFQADAMDDSVNGLWRFTFTPVSLGTATGRVDWWRYSSFRTPTYFVGADTIESISGMATGFRTIAVGAWDSKNAWVGCDQVLHNDGEIVGNFSGFSSRGPTRDGRLKPEITAPGSEIASTLTQDPGPPGCNGFLYLPGLLHEFATGTSLSSPHVAGAVALIMQKYGPVTPEFAVQFLEQRARRDAFTETTPNERWGFGKLWMGDMIDPLVHVVAFNGGEVLAVSGTTTLQWNASDNVGVTLVDLLLSRSGAGGPWESLATGLPNTGSWGWSVTGPASSNCYLKVVAHDAMENVGSDLSDAAAAIVDGPTATVLSRFDGTGVEAGIELRWRFAEPASVGEVNVERADGAAGPWRAVTLERRDQDGTTIALDRAVEAGGRSYWYRLATTVDGAALTFGPIETATRGGITRLALGAPDPNPSDGAIRMVIETPGSTSVDIAIFDTQGRRVATLARGVLSAGRRAIEWDGRRGGSPAPAGLYFAKLQAPGAVLSRRFVIAR
jgi:hypothetical protein